MSPLERRGWCDAAADALCMRPQNSGSLRLLTALVVDGQVTKVAARIHCAAKSKRGQLAPKKSVQVYASTLKTVLAEMGWPDALTINRDTYVLDAASARAIDALVRAHA